MDIWIRSQSGKSLVKVDTLLVAYIDDKYYICQHKGESKILLGEYDTKEGAVEVLDEIQSLLQGNENCTLIGKTQYIGIISNKTQNMIYEMSKE